MQSSKLISFGQDSPTKFGLSSVKSMSFLQALPRKSFIATMTSQNYQKYKLVFENDHLQNQLKIIDWRMKTEFPIVKIIFYNILQKNVQPERSLVQIAVQTFPSSFQNIPKLLLSQILDFMKEAMIGFQRLYARFGTFDICDNMIVVNKFSQCRVWFNQNLALNSPASRQAKTQKVMLLQIVKIFQDKCIKSAISTQFFSKLSKISKIVSAIQFLDTFSKNNKQALLNKLSPINESKSINFDKESSKKIPKFIMKTKEQRKQFQNKQYLDSPTSIKNLCLPVDLTQTNLSVRTATPSKTITSNNSNEIKPNDQKFLVWSVRHSKKLTKQISHDQFQGFASMQISKFKTENYLKQKKETNEMPEDLYFTKMPTQQSSKIRKFSTADKNMIIQCDQINNKLASYEGQKCNQGSQQTNTTGQSCREEKQFQNTNQPVPRINIIKFIDQGDKIDIFKTNGWVKRLKTLGNARQTICSHCDGDEIFSEDLKYESQQLLLLGQMGGQLQRSIISPD